MTSIMTTSLGAGFWMPEQASSYAADVDWTFFFVMWISVFFTLLITGLVIYFAIRHWDGGRRGVAKGHGGRGALGKGPSHHTALEMTWTVVPLMIVLAIFLFGFRGFLHMTQPPDHAYEIVVRATSWSWSFQYPTGRVSDTLRVPVDENVRVVLTVPRDDVIHSFFVPEFRVKMDAVPGRYNEAWFRPTQVGQYRLYCAEYCGQGHSVMLSQVEVMERDEFYEWVEDVDDDRPPHEIGGDLFRGVGGCIACHTVDGTDGIGPTMLDLYGSEQTYTDGQARTVDRDHIRNAILQPNRTVRQGFDPIMPSFQGLLSDNDIENIIAYLQSISEHYDGPPHDAADDDDQENGDEQPQGSEADEAGSA